VLLLWRLPLELHCNSWWSFRIGHLGMLSLPDSVVYTDAIDLQVTCRIIQSRWRRQRL
jgi:hypothetical protein